MKQLQNYALSAAAVICLCLLPGSCQNAAKNAATAQTTPTDSVAAGPASFPFPEIPPIIVSPEERANYLMQHYWENFDFADTTLLQRAEITEQGVVDFLDLLRSQATSETITGYLQTFCELFTPHTQARHTMPRLVEKYLYESNSPLRNEPLFDTFLTCLTSQEAMQTDPGRSRWQFLKKLIARNNPGQKATDFTYYTPEGNSNTLYHTPGKTTIVFFYDPLCENCHYTLERMKTSPELATKTANGQVTVLAVYTEDDEAVWRRSLNEIPDTWLNVTDRSSIRIDALYDLKGMPSLYLLDASKKVILKDVSFEEIFGYLGFTYMQQ